MELGWHIYPLLILAGLAAGMINTVAGYGSMITLALLSFLGLPTTIANGTNRIGVLTQSLLGYITYSRAKTTGSVGGQRLAIVASVVGAAVGALLATQLPDTTFDYVVGSIVVLLLLTILLQPKKWLVQSNIQQQNMPKWMQALIFFAIGFYGGFIQAGVGILLLAALVLGSGLSLVQANSIKIFIVLIYTIPALLLFIYYNQVHWIYGGLLAVGQGIGAVLSARFAVTNKNANVWIRRLLIVILILAAMQFFNLLPPL